MSSYQYLVWILSILTPGPQSAPTAELDRGKINPCWKTEVAPRLGILREHFHGSLVTPTPCPAWNSMWISWMRAEFLAEGRGRGVQGWQQHPPARYPKFPSPMTCLCAPPCLMIRVQLKGFIQNSAFSHSLILPSPEGEGLHKLEGLMALLLGEFPADFRVITSL